MARIMCEVCQTMRLGTHDGPDTRFQGVCESCMPIPGVSDDARANADAVASYKPPVLLSDRVEVLEKLVAELIEWKAKHEAAHGEPKAER